MSLENILEMRHEKTLVLQSECSNHYARLKVLFAGPEGLVVITWSSLNDAAEGQGRLYPGGGERGVLKGRGASGNDCITRAERRGKKK